MEKIMNKLTASKSCFHAIKIMEDELLEHGFQKLNEADKWKVELDKNYYCIRNGSSIIAFHVPKSLESYRFQIAASHSDSPTFKIKRNPIINRNGMYMLNVEGYGGMLCSTWLDRPLSIAGRVMVKDENGVGMQLFDIDEDLLVIPNLAIHMNRSANENMTYNKQIDMLPLFSNEISDFDLYLSNKLNIKKEQLLSHDLYLYLRDKPRLIGANKEFILGARLDDLECAYSSLDGFVNANYPDSGVQVFACFDNEEVGSLTKQGASSTFLKDVLYRISDALSLTMSDYIQALRKSFMISCDNAQGLHPNHMEKYDVTHQCKMNEGIVIKYNANQKYTSDAIGSSVFQMLCDKSGVNYQWYCNRSDMLGGSTLGNLAMAQASMHGVDIGLPQLAMHSCYECAGSKDLIDMMKVMKQFYESKLVFANESYFYLD